ncbi:MULTISPECIES: toxin-antitoxin system, toxin component [unclassified Streptomyces]|uniref:toxin-antitoxin system, toxin component n=1 Tax=unclassified Streptomyces TaxID=2593676 RepID=UPI00136CA19B|nr:MULTISPECIES: toxin-antitoxin system, toxin component [unclassified Streptomyces]MCW5254207.1 toxin-antitoxin system, toxin component [Streptomyces sp. SHP 1-2]MYU23958.1 toxin-antitoxin system, toxin component [Streptomyces sp. SID8352]
MRRLCGELVTELTLSAPESPVDLYGSLCATMSRRRGRPVRFRMAAFPPGTASGLWLDMADQDLVVVEERTAPDHQLVILGHELWHMTAGHHGGIVGATPVTHRLLAGGGGPVDEETLRATVRAVAARSRFDLADEREAESFGLLLASKCRTWMAGSTPPGAVRRDHLAARIEASLGYPG